MNANDKAPRRALVGAARGRDLSRFPCSRNRDASDTTPLATRAQGCRRCGGRRFVARLRMERPRTYYSAPCPNCNPEALNE